VVHLKLDLAFEETVLSACLRRDDYLQAAVRQVRDHHFATPQHGWIWRVLEQNHARHRERPTIKMFVEEAKREFKKKEERTSSLRLLHKLAKSRPRAPKTALQYLSRFVTKVNYHKIAEDLADALEEDDVTKAKAAFGAGSRVMVEERKYRHVRWMEDFPDRQKHRRYQKLHPDEFRVIPTGWRSLDRILSGGIRIGEMGLIMGTTGRGKSIALNNVARIAVKKGFKVALFGFEMGAEQIATRQDAAWSGITYNKFKTYGFKPSELRALKLRYERMAKRYKNHLHILSFPVRSAEISDIHSALDDLADEYDFVPDLILMDSCDHLLATAQKSESFRLQQSEVYWGFKQLLEERNLAGWTSVHAGREWAKKIATAEASAESYDKTRICDLLISINDPDAGSRRARVVVEDEDEDEEAIMDEYAKQGGPRKLRVNVGKYRDGDSHFTFEVRADFARMRITEIERDREESEAA